MSIKTKNKMMAKKVARPTKKKIRPKKQVEAKIPRKLKTFEEKDGVEARAIASDESLLNTLTPEMTPFKRWMLYNPKDVWTLYDFYSSIIKKFIKERREVKVSFLTKIFGDPFTTNLLTSNVERWIDLTLFLVYYIEHQNDLPKDFQDKLIQSIKKTFPEEFFKQYWVRM